MRYLQAVNISKQSQDASDSLHAAIEPPAPKKRALTPAGMDKHAKKALWDQRKAERARARAQKVSTPLCVHDQLLECIWTHRTRWSLMRKLLEIPPCRHTLISAQTLAAGLHTCCFCPSGLHHACIMLAVLADIR